MTKNDVQPKHVKSGQKIAGSNKLSIVVNTHCWQNIISLYYISYYMFTSRLCVMPSAILFTTIKMSK